MKIFYSNLNGLPPYSLSGAEITIDEFLKVFSEHGHEVLCVNCDEKWNFYQKKYNKIYDNSYFLIEETNTKKYFFHSAECFKSNLKIMLEKFKPDFIFSQLNYLEELSRYCEEYKECKIVYFMHSNLAVGKNSNSQLDILLSNKVLKIICVSKYILNNLPIELQKKSEVIYPIINENNYISEIKNKKYIVFFNPISIKGINIVISLSKIFRNEKFIIYETWGHISESYKTIIKENENIEIRNKTNNFKEIFEDAKIYLLPSQCNEGFGRGIIEANINNIPVLASDIGGIREASGENQLLVHDYWQINEWKEKLKYLLDAENYKKYSEYASANYQRFLSMDGSEKLLAILKSKGNY